MRSWIPVMIGSILEVAKAANPRQLVAIRVKKILLCESSHWQYLHR